MHLKLLRLNEILEYNKSQSTSVSNSPVIAYEN